MHFTKRKIASHLRVGIGCCRVCVCVCVCVCCGTAFDTITEHMILRNELLHFWKQFLWLFEMRHSIGRVGRCYRILGNVWGWADGFVVCFWFLVDQIGWSWTSLESWPSLQEDFVRSFLVWRPRKWDLRPHCQWRGLRVCVFAMCKLYVSFLTLDFPQQKPQIPFRKMHAQNEMHSMYDSFWRLFRAFFIFGIAIHFTGLNTYCIDFVTETLLVSVILRTSSWEFCAEFCVLSICTLLDVIDRLCAQSNSGDIHHARYRAGTPVELCTGTKVTVHWQIQTVIHFNNVLLYFLEDCSFCNDHDAITAPVLLFASFSMQFISLASQASCLSSFNTLGGLLLLLVLWLWLGLNCNFWKEKLLDANICLSFEVFRFCCRKF